jgi:hypothetical protein
MPTAQKATESNPETGWKPGRSAPSVSGDVMELGDADQPTRQVYLGSTEMGPHQTRTAYESAVGPLQTNEWSSFAEMREAGAQVERDPRTNRWYRVVTVHTGQTVVRDGLAYYPKRTLKRLVALTRTSALQNALVQLNEEWQKGCDFWDAGLQTWVRNGLKREKEAPENLGNDTSRYDELELAGEADQQALRRQRALVAAEIGAITRSKED